MKSCLTGAALLRTGFDLPGKKSRIDNLKKETENPNFWKDHEKAKTVQKEIAELEKELKNQSDFETESQNLIEILNLNDEKLLKEVSEKFSLLESRFKKHELKIYLGGKYEKNSLRHRAIHCKKRKMDFQR